MTVTVAALNQTVLDACDSVTDNDAEGTDTVDFKENGTSVYWTKKASGNNDCTFTKASGTWDLSGAKHLRFWGLFMQGSLINVEASGGIQVGVTDGSNTGYWYVGGRDTYPGGWANFVVDVSTTVDAGTKPTMTAITDVIVRINLTGTSKNFDNTWVDNVHVCDGLLVYGDDGGGYMDFEDVYQVDATDDSATVGGWGIIKKIGGVYFLSGELEFGDSAGTNGLKFQAKNQTVVFQDLDVNSNLYNFTVVDNGTGTTEFLLGEKSGTAGISGCTVMVEDVSQTPLFDIIATDTDISDFGIYGCSIIGADSTSLPASSTKTEVLNTSFISCGQVDPSTCTVTDCNFISSSATSTGALLYDSATHGVTYCNFIANTYAIQITTATTFTEYGTVFTNCTTDLNNTSGGSVTWNNDNASGSNASTYTGDTTIVTAVDVTILVKDVGDLSVIEDARVLVKADSGGDLPGDASVTITRVDTTASVSHTSHGLSNGDLVVILGANEGEYDGVKTISNVTTHAYDYTVSGSPTSPATGTITASYVIVSELTNASGIATESLNYTSDQPISGRARFYGATKYVTGNIVGEITSTGFSQTVLLVEEL